MKHIKTNINDELIIKGEKDKSSVCKDLSQTKTMYHPLVLGSSPVFAVWRTVDLHVHPVIRADSHSLAWETKEPRALKGGEQLLGRGGLLWRCFKNIESGSVGKTPEKQED